MRKLLLIVLIALSYPTTLGAVPHRNRRPQPTPQVEWCFDVPMTGVSATCCEDTEEACNLRRELVSREAHRQVQTTSCYTRPRQ